MADTTEQLDEDDCITPKQSTTITLQYPSLPVGGTPDSWLSTSLLVPMASNQDEGSVRSIDDTTSSLDDSAYEFIDDNSFATTDDEEPPSTEPVSSADDNAHEASDEQDLERTLSAGRVYPHPSESLMKDGMRDSAYTSTSEEDIFCRDPSLEPQQQPINQQRPSVIKFEGIHHGEAVFPLDHAPAPHNFAYTVRQHMLDQDLSLEGPYRLLYVGHVAARERIVAKVGAALASTARVEAHRPLKYSVVPMPSSDDPTCPSDSNPVLLDWSGHEIIVYQCVNASFGRSDSGHNTIEMALDGNRILRSFWSGSKFDVSEGWESPDIAIFYLSGRDSVSAKQTRRFARSFVARHKIPTIVINEEPSWNRPPEAMTIERLTPHVCLQTKGDTASASRVVKRLPIDLKTFTQLDASQLNRNLAYLSVACGMRQSEYQDKRSARSGGWRSIRKGGKWDELNAYFSAVPLFSYLLGILATAGIIMALSIGMGHLSVFSLHSIDHNPNVNMTSLTSTRSATATAMAPPAGKPLTPQSVIVAEPPKLLTSQRLLAGNPHSDLATLLESTPMMINKSEKFQVHVLGNAHIVLRPPHWFMRLRRAPKLNITVTQGDRVLKHQLSTPFDGMYALGIPIDEAHGLINITVWTESKPKIRENWQIDFGTSWLDAAGWRKAVNALSGSFWQNLELLQESLGAVYTRSGGELHTLMQKTLRTAKALKTESGTIGKASMNRMAGTTDRILTSSRDVSSNISRLLKQRKESAARQVSLEVERWRRRLSLYITSKADVARIYANAAPSAYAIHLRNTQKKALKVWWSMTGLPQQRPITVAAKREPPFRGGRLTRKPTISRSRSG
ncbi:MAG: hypothetical protein Q9186_000272 [Xanthomendoza sp. 1 TL-2023]